MEVSNLLLTGALSLGFIPLFLTEHLDFVLVCQAFDGLGLQIVVVAPRQTLHREGSLCDQVTTLSSTAVVVVLRIWVDVGGRVVATVHHQPLVLLLAVPLFVKTRLFGRHVRVLYGTEVLATVGFDDDDIALANIEAGVFEEVEDIYA